jgi:3-mercaptopyruvate sulfurtransferase SseA
VVASLLRARGFDNVSDLAGGYNAWADAHAIARHAARRKVSEKTVSSAPDRIMQNSEAISVLAFADLTPREPRGQYLLR